MIPSPRTGVGWRRAAGPVLGAFLLLGAGRLVLPSDPTPRRHVIEMRGMAFDPAVVLVAAGDTVVWVNRDIVPHTATATGPSGWDTGSLARGESRMVVARRRAETTYFCALHPTMRATLRVR